VAWLARVVIERKLTSIKWIDVEGVSYRRRARLKAWRTPDTKHRDRSLWIEVSTNEKTGELWR
jgi:hypothetical protein